jgi:hypothetical protein
VLQAKCVAAVVAAKFDCSRGARDVVHPAMTSGNCFMVV